jgi:hypothetical protein
MSLAPRRVVLFDVMVVVAATAVGLAVVRGAVPGVLHIVPTSPSIRFLLPRPMLEACLILLAVWPVPAMWTLALLAIRLLSPRPPWRRLARQPGVMACCAVALACAFNVLVLAALSFKVRFLGDLLPITALPVGLAVMLIWITLRLVGHWCPESCPFDRAGRWLGLFWVGTVPVCFAVFLSLLR